MKTLDNLCMLVFHIIIQTYNIHHTSMDNWIYNLCHASKHMKCTFKCIIQVHELAPPTYVLKILIDPIPLSYLSPYHLYLYFFPPLLSFYYLSTLFLPLTLISLFFPPLSSMAIKVQNVDRLRLSMPINGVRIIFPNFIQSRSFAKDI